MRGWIMIGNTEFWGAIPKSRVRCQHIIWHEGYHHGQIKLALMAAGKPFDDEETGPVTWDLWMEKGVWKNGR